MNLVTWMIYLVVVGTLLAAAGWLLERGLLRLNAPVRWVWALMLAGILGIVLSGVGAGSGSDAGAAGAPDPPVAGVPTFPEAPPTAELGVVADPWPSGVTLVESALAPLRVIGTGLGAGAARVADALPLAVSSTALAVVWVGGTLLLSILLGGAAVRLARRRQRWPLVRIGRDRVRISDSLGPAAVGVARPEIVLPRWILELAPERLRIVLLHEREHIAGRDTLLLAGATVTLLLFFWNPAVWWIHGRLRAAVEMDCDRRVLRQGISRRCYGNLLLQVSSRERLRALPVAALVEPQSLLERRLRQMTRFNVRHGLLALMGSGLLSLLLIVVACETRTPSPAETTDEAPSEAAVYVPSHTGTITGRVSSQEGGPLAGAQVGLPGTGYGTIADAEGRFVIRGVPPGIYNVVALRIGYTTARQANVRVEPGETASADLTLRQEVLRLQGIIVTGAAGP